MASPQQGNGADTLTPLMYATHSTAGGFQGDLISAHHLGGRPGVIGFLFVAAKRCAGWEGSEGGRTTARVQCTLFGCPVH